MTAIKDKVINKIRNGEYQGLSESEVMEAYNAGDFNAIDSLTTSINQNEQIMQFRNNRSLFEQLDLARKKDFIDEAILNYQERKYQVVGSLIGLEGVLDTNDILVAGEIN